MAATIESRKNGEQPAFVSFPRNDREFVYLKSKISRTGTFKRLLLICLIDENAFPNFSAQK